MEVEENDISFLFGFFSFWHFVYRFCRGQQKYEYLEERGKMRFHLISSDMLQISRVSLGFLGFFLFHENILFCHNSQNMKFCCAFVRILHWNTENMLALHKTWRSSLYFSTNISDGPWSYSSVASGPTSLSLFHMVFKLSSVVKGKLALAIQGGKSSN